MMLVPGAIRSLSKEDLTRSTTDCASIIFLEEATKQMSRSESRRQIISLKASLEARRSSANTYLIYCPRALRRQRFQLAARPRLRSFRANLTLGSDKNPVMTPRCYRWSSHPERSVRNRRIPDSERIL